MESNFWNLMNLPQPATAAVQLNINSPQTLGMLKMLVCNLSFIQNIFIYFSSRNSGFPQAPR